MRLLKLPMLRPLRPMDMFLSSYLTSLGLWWFHGSLPWKPPCTGLTVLHISHSFAVSLVDSSFSVLLNTDVFHVSSSLQNIYNWTAYLKLNYKIQFLIFSSIFPLLRCFLSQWRVPPFTQLFKSEHYPWLLLLPLPHGTSYQVLPRSSTTLFSLIMLHFMLRIGLLQ